MWNFISDKCMFYVVYFSGLKYPLNSGEWDYRCSRADVVYLLNCHSLVICASFVWDGGGLRCLFVGFSRLNGPFLSPLPSRKPRMVQTDVQISCPVVFQHNSLTYCVCLQVLLVNFRHRMLKVLRQFLLRSTRKKNGELNWQGCVPFAGFYLCFCYVI